MTDQNENSVLVSNSDDVAFIRSTGEVIIKHIGVTAGLYYNLIMGIRRRAIGPRVVSQELLALGFHKSRVSEINRISQLPDDKFSAYEAHTVGFQRALLLARISDESSGDKKATPALDIVRQDTELCDEKHVLDVALEPSGPDDLHRSVSTSSTPETRVLKAVAVIFSQAIRSRKVWNSGDGWTLTLECSKGRKLKKNDTSVPITNLSIE